MKRLLGRYARLPGLLDDRVGRNHSTAFPLKMRFLLALRAIFFVLLLPGTVAGYVPFRMLRSADRLRVPELSLSSVGASMLAVAGMVVLLRCVWDFFAKGKGTLAPIDPPRVLVVSGLYRFYPKPHVQRRSRTPPGRGLALR
jgi:hypothetical protein